ncbi:hypothetical protein D9M72_359400 [compost metagenome]
MVGFQPGRLIGGHGEGRPVCLAEAKTAKGLQRPPDLVHDLGGVTPHPGFLAEEFLHLGFQEFVPQGAAEFVSPGQPAFCHDIEGLQDLFMEHRHAMGFLEHGLEVRMRIDLRRKTVAVFQEGTHHVRLHGPRAEQRNVDDEVVEFTRGHLADQFPLPGGFYLEATQGVRAPDQLVGWFVIQWHRVKVNAAVSRDVVRARSVRAGSMGAGCHYLGLGGMQPDNFPDSKGHGALHPDAEDVQLEHAHRVHVVLVELAHGQAKSAGLDGCPVQQGGIAEDHPARVHRDVPRQAVEPLG